LESAEGAVRSGGERLNHEERTEEPLQVSAKKIPART
jgi:hypothetical protein